MCCYNDFKLQLNQYLLGISDFNNNIIKNNVRNLENYGEFKITIDKFQYKIPNLQSNLKEIIKDENQIKTLIDESKIWRLQISKCLLLEQNLYIFLDRPSTFKSVIKQVLFENSKYGFQELPFIENICIRTNFDEDNLSKINLSQLRIILLKNTAINLLEFNKTYASERSVLIYFSLNSDKTIKEKMIICAPVITKKEFKQYITAEDFYRKRSIDMRLMAEHKYGLRITSHQGWQEIFEKLGEAAVNIELLQVKSNHTITVNINDPSSCSKGASFILYNCARLATLIKEFDRKVSANVYPALPSFEDIDFTLLTQPEEWELLYIHILQFPCTIHNCIKNILNGKIEIYNLCNTLSTMCCLFSVYYRRVRILTEPRSHLFPILYARITLLKAVEQVLHNGLYLLNIQPIKQM